MDIVNMIDPRRITHRLFGGPHFCFGEVNGRLFYPHGDGRAWRISDIVKGWHEGFDPAPVSNLPTRKGAIE